MARPRIIDRDRLAVMLAQGYSNQAIAERMGCAVVTIANLRTTWLEAGNLDAPRRARGNDAIGYCSIEHSQWQQIGDWPAGIHFEDADVPDEPRMRATAPSFGNSLIGNSSAMCTEEKGAV